LDSAAERTDNREINFLTDLYRVSSPHNRVRGKRRLTDEESVDWSLVLGERIRAVCPRPTHVKKFAFIAGTRRAGGATHAFAARREGQDHGVSGQEISDSRSGPLDGPGALVAEDRWQGETVQLITGL
jgi:hypothetical protein